MPEPQTESIISKQRGRRQNREHDSLQRKVGEAIDRNRPNPGGAKKSLLEKLSLVRPRVYRLKGYTTVRKVNRKIRAKRAQKRLRNFILFILAVLAAAYLMIRYQPFRDLREFFRIIGIDS